MVASSPRHHEGCAPVDQTGDSSAEFEAPRRERVDRAVASGIELAFNHTCFLELSQSLGQEIGRYTRQSGLQLPISRGTDEKFANDEQAPPIPDDVECPC